MVIPRFSGKFCLNRPSKFGIVKTVNPAGKAAADDGQGLTIWSHSFRLNNLDSFNCNYSWKMRWNYSKDKSKCHFGILLRNFYEAKFGRKTFDFDLSLLYDTRRGWRAETWGLKTADTFETTLTDIAKSKILTN